MWDTGRGAIQLKLPKAFGVQMILLKVSSAEHGALDFTILLARFQP